VANGVILRLEMPKKTSVRLDDRSVARLEELAQRLGTSQADAVRWALMHLEGTLQRGEGVFFPPPAGPDGPTSGPSGPARRPLRVVEKARLRKPQRPGA
jgi:hypothetical protein